MAMIGFTDKQVNLSIAVDNLRYNPLKDPSGT